MPRLNRYTVAGALLLLWFGGSGCAGRGRLFLPEQRDIAVRGPAALPKVALPDVPPPATVADPKPDAPDGPLSLDDAIRLTLQNTKVVRILTGVTATASGQTIYDPAISNTQIDVQQARFDPNFSVQPGYNRTETPTPFLNPLDPNGASILGLRTDNFNVTSSLTKTTLLGGTASLSFIDNLSGFQPGLFPLNPQNQRALALQYSQPLLRNAGVAVNLAPVVVARINTERSYWLFKDSVQESVRGVVEAYWAVVFARTDVWARRQQVVQGQEAYDRAAARLRGGLENEAVVAQAKAALANFKATLIVSEANLIQREDALRNIMGLPPSDETKLVPMTPPSEVRLGVNWKELIALAEDQRPDLIQLKLIIEADKQTLRQDLNQTLPQMDAVTLYRFNGLEGRAPAGTVIGSNAQFSDMTLGVNVSLPLAQRAARATYRQQELILARDWANLEQGLHSAIHDLATGVRNLARDFEQYKAFHEAEIADRTNLEKQALDYTKGRTIFLNYLQALTDWGNAVSAEAQALTQYNTDLADLERLTGTILESHGIQFLEEQYASIGPLGRLAKPKNYPMSLPPGPNANVYPTSNEPAENFFDLKPPLRPGDTSAPEIAPVPRKLPDAK
jgi:outer membrane protein TolC